MYYEYLYTSYSLFELSKGLNNFAAKGFLSSNASVLGEGGRMEGRDPGI
jgi:hypothetical protein